MGGGGGLLSALKRKKKAGSFPSEDDENGRRHHHHRRRASNANTASSTPATTRLATETASATPKTPPPPRHELHHSQHQAHPNIYPVAITCGSGRRSLFSNPFHHSPYPTPISEYNGPVTSPSATTTTSTTSGTTNSVTGSQRKPQYVAPPPCGTAAAAAAQSLQDNGSIPSPIDAVDANSNADPSTTTNSLVDTRPISPSPILTNGTEESSLDEAEDVPTTTAVADTTTPTTDTATLVEERKDVEALTSDAGCSPPNNKDKENTIPEEENPKTVQENEEEKQEVTESPTPSTPPRCPSPPQSAVTPTANSTAFSTPAATPRSCASSSSNTTTGTTSSTGTSTRHPHIRGKAVASRAALFEASGTSTPSKNYIPSPMSAASSPSSYSSSISSSSPYYNYSKQGQAGRLPVPSSPPLSSRSQNKNASNYSNKSNNKTNKLRSSKQDFWENVFQPPQPNNITNPASAMMMTMMDDKHHEDVDNDELLDPTASDMTETEEYSESQIMNNNCSIIEESSFCASSLSLSPPRNPHSTSQQRQQHPRSPPMTVDDAQWRAAYELWYSKGLIPWKPQDQPTHHQETDHIRWNGEEKQDERENMPYYTSSASLLSLKNKKKMKELALADLSALIQSRDLHKAKSLQCPILTLFGGGSSCVSVPGVPIASVHVVVSSPSSAVSSSSTQRAIAYTNYVQAYKAYVHDRSNTAKARAMLEARHLLDLAKQQQQQQQQTVVNQNHPTLVATTTAPTTNSATTVIA